MRKKVFIPVLAIVILASVHLAEAQAPEKVPLIGYLGNQDISSSFREGLRELGYVEGRDIVIVGRLAYGKRERRPKLAAELVNLKVDVIVAAGSPQARAAKKATTTIPIVAVTGRDPQRSGLVASLARPGGNVTGFTLFTRELGGKHLELLKEAFPSVSRVGVLREADSGEPRYAQIAIAAEALGVEHHSIEVQSSNLDFDGAFEAAMKRRVDAFVVISGTLLNHHRPRTLELVAKTQLPAMYDRGGWVRLGGLMSYGADRSDLNRRAATYVDKILKGAKPGDLPVQRAIRFNLIINLKTAKKQGITFSPQFLARADKVIK